MRTTTCEFAPEQNRLPGHHASRMGMAWRVLVILALLAMVAVLTALTPAPGRAQGIDARPSEIPDSVIARGRKVFNGPANCVACHGPEGQGTTKGPDLTDTKWNRGQGTYFDILDRVLHGVSRRESSTGSPMPMRGWSPASDEGVRDVAAYVWSLSHPRTGP